MMGFGDLLGAQILLDRHRVVRAALHGSVIGDDHALLVRPPSDSSDNASRRHIAAVHPVGRKLRHFEERRPGIEKSIDSITRQELAAGEMPRASFIRAAAGNLGYFLP